MHTGGLVYWYPGPGSLLLSSVTSSYQGIATLLTWLYWSMVKLSQLVVHLVLLCAGNGMGCWVVCTVNHRWAVAMLYVLQGVLIFPVRSREHLLAFVVGHIKDQHVFMVKVEHLCRVQAQHWGSS